MTTLNANNSSLFAPLSKLMGQTPPTTANQPTFAQGSQGVTLQPDVLQIGNQRFGAPVNFGEIREVKANVLITAANIQEVIAKASALTAKNGYDEIYFVGEDQKLYVTFAEKAQFSDVRVGYLGRANVGGRNQAIEVVAVEDENNTFYQGMMSTWKWLNNVLQASVGSEASKSVNGLVTTAVGSFVAAAALKSTPVAAAPVAGPGFFQAVGGAMTGAVRGFVQTMASVVLFGVGAIGAVSLITGLKGYFTKGDITTIDMVSGRY